MNHASGARWLWLALAVLAADRASKYAVEQRTSEGFRHTLVPGFAALVHSLNSGVAFGMFSQGAPRWAGAVLIGSAAAVVLLLCWLLVTGRAGDALSRAGIALITAGAAGNMLDRILHKGVTDFVELHAGSFYWPAFNVADAAITVGAALVICEFFRGNRAVGHEKLS